jgi:hypothetical protein
MAGLSGGVSGFGAVSAAFSVGGVGVCFFGAGGFEVSGCCAIERLQVRQKRNTKTEADIPRIFFILIPCEAVWLPPRD